MKTKLIYLIMLFAISTSVIGCGYLVAGGAGATGGYILRDEGYEVQTPVKKENSSDQTGTK